MIVRKPAVKPLHFSISDWLDRATVAFGVTMGVVRWVPMRGRQESKPPDFAAGPAVAFGQFVWPLETGLACVAIGGLGFVRL